MWLQQFSMYSCRKYVFLSLYEYDFSADQMTALFIFNSKSSSASMKGEGQPLAPLEEEKFSIIDAGYVSILSDASIRKSIISDNGPFPKKYYTWNQSKPFGGLFDCHCDCYCKFSLKRSSTLTKKLFVIIQILVKHRHEVINVFILN